MMYAFMVLNLPYDTTDEAVEARYVELVQRFPPDRAPEQFALVRRAYEQLRTASDRLEARLFGRGGEQASIQAFAGLRSGGRLSPAELAALLCAEGVGDG